MSTDEDLAAVHGDEALHWMLTAMKPCIDPNPFPAVFPRAKDLVEKNWLKFTVAISWNDVQCGSSAAVSRDDLSQCSLERAWLCSKPSGLKHSRVYNGGPGCDLGSEEKEARTKN